MNRVSSTFGDVEALLAGREAVRAVEALLIGRVGLIETLQSSLAEAHEYRRIIAGRPGEAEVIRRINYWEAILVWLKDQAGPDVIFTCRAI
jgi:hypothetical protein